MVVNRASHLVTKNLHYWLGRIHNLGYGDRVWIDALSINRDNTAEKEQQIAMMGSIYQGAREVLIGLGEHIFPDDSAPIRDSLESLSIDSHLRDMDCFKARRAPQMLFKGPGIPYCL